MPEMERKRSAAFLLPAPGESGSHHPSPNKHLSTKSQQPFVPASEKNLGGKVKSNIPQPRREPMAFKGVPAPKKSSGISPSFFPLTRKSSMLEGEIGNLSSCS